MDNLNQIKQCIESNNYLRVMNNCKWNAIYSLFQGEGLPFLFRSKSIDGSVFPEDHLRFDVREVMPLHNESLLWLEVHSIKKESIGRLIEPKVIDNTSLAIELAEKAKAGFIITDYGLKVFGYIEHNQHIEFYTSGA